MSSDAAMLQEGGRFRAARLLLPPLSAAFLLFTVLPSPAAGPGMLLTQVRDRAEDVTGVRPGGVLSASQRDDIRRAFAEIGVDPFDVGGTVLPDEPATAESQIDIGERIPIVVPVRPVPDRLLAAFPKLEGYEYRLFGDDLALVEKDTGVVADIMREVYVRGSGG